VTRSPPAFDELRTARLFLRRMRDGDLAGLLRMNADERVMATMGGTRPAAETESYFHEQLVHWQQHGFGWWMVLDAATGELAGRGGLRRVEVGGAIEVEVGYAFLPQFWGRGFATELAHESVRVGFAELELPDLVSFTLTTNRASRRVMEKAGFQYERDVIYKGFASVLYRQTRRMWEAKQLS
jgi:RimJ/RimL family protein N-acetyltransferase